MTVSRVIHDRAKVREETRTAVLAAIRELNYEPNLAARNLVMAGELRIGVIYSNPSAAFMSDFLIGVFEEATNAGARLILVRGEDGQSYEWALETGGGVGRLIRSNWRQDSMKPGDTVTVVAHPLKDGTTGALLVSVTLADGTRLGAPI